MTQYLPFDPPQRYDCAPWCYLNPNFFFPLTVCSVCVTPLSDYLNRSDNTNERRGRNPGAVQVNWSASPHLEPPTPSITTRLGPEITWRGPQLVNEP